MHNERVAGSSRVRQRELHRFTSPAELAQVLTSEEWPRWTRAVAWRERAIEFDWPGIRQRLQAELEAWVEQPSGASHRRDHKVERLASSLSGELARLSLARASDAALLERMHPSLAALRESIDRLLDNPDRTPANTKEPTMFLTATNRPADDAFDKGMTRWWSGDRRGALTHFRRALKHDANHADAHNHLGIAKLEARRLKDAERHFRTAVEGAERHLERDGALVPWGIIENRPYLRALSNLALVLTESRQHTEALAIYERLLALNPDDNQGVRWLIGLSYLRAGDDQRTVEAFERTCTEEVGCAFGLALARMRVGSPSAEIGEALLYGFGANRYVAPMLLGETWRRLDGFHGSNMAEPEWAHDVVAAQAAFWHAVPRGAEVLRFWWRAAPVVAWRQRLDEIIVELGTLPMGDERSATVGEAFALRSEDTVRELIRAVRSAS